MTKQSVLTFGGSSFMKIRLSLSNAQRWTIENMMKQTKSRVEAQRCRIVLLLADGETPSQVQKTVGCVPQLFTPPFTGLKMSASRASRISGFNPMHGKLRQTFGSSSLHIWMENQRIMGGKVVGGRGSCSLCSYARTRPFRFLPPI